MARKKKLFKLLFYGAITVTLYSVLFINEPLVKTLCARGGLYALFPILTAFIFSFAHGNFTNYFWQVLGIEAKKKTAQISAHDRPAERKEIRAQLRA